LQGGAPGPAPPRIRITFILSCYPRYLFRFRLIRLRAHFFPASRLIDCG